MFRNLLIVNLVGGYAPVQVSAVPTTTTPSTTATVKTTTTSPTMTTPSIMLTTGNLLSNLLPLLPLFRTGIFDFVDVNLM